MLIAIIVVIGLSILILGHEAGHFFAAKAFGLKIDEFGFGFPPKIFGRRRDETEYSFNWLPFGGFVKIAGENDPPLFDKGTGQAPPEISVGDKKRLFNFQPAWKKSVILLSGVAVNFLIGWFLLSAVLVVGAPQAVVVSQVEQNSPASVAGFAAGDIIKGYATAQEFVNFVDLRRGQEIAINIVRNGKEIIFKLTPRINPPPDEGAIGIAIVEAGEARQGFFSALWNGLKESATVMTLVFRALYDLIKNLLIHGSLLEGVVGPVGIFSIAEETGHIGLIYLFRLISIISLNLAVVNVIPFPALDGGRFFMILAEKIKGSPVSRKTEVWANGIGFAFLIALMTLLTARDIGKLF